MEKFRDGFKLAEMDLDLRGPGDYLGTRQSGVPVFKIAKITDQDIATLARDPKARRSCKSTPLSTNQNTSS